MSSSQDTSTAYPHHKHVGPCYTRPAYRDPRRKNAVKVFTIADESTYLLISGVPSLKLEQTLKDKCRQFGPITSIRTVPEYPDVEAFTEVYLVKFETLQSARRAKRSLDEFSFFGGSLTVCYAPEHESVAECRVKLHLQRQLGNRVARRVEYEHSSRLSRSCNKELIESKTGGDHIDPDKSALKTSIEITTQPSTSNSTRTILLPTPTLPTTLDRLPCVSQPITNPSNSVLTGDPLSDARSYWSSLGINLTSHNQQHTSSSKVDEITSVPNPSPQPPRRPIPLPVQQALACRSHSDKLSKSKESDSTTTMHSQENDKSDSFIPRCLIGLPNPKPSRPPPARQEQPVAKRPLRVGELKRLAMQLGPMQGPHAPPPVTTTATTSKRVSCHDNSQSAAKRAKRIVFHRIRSSRETDDSQNDD